MPRDVTRDVCTAKPRGRSVLTQPFTRPSKHCQEQTRARKQTPSAVLLRMARKMARFKRKGEKNLKKYKKKSLVLQQRARPERTEQQPPAPGGTGMSPAAPKSPKTQSHRG